MITQNPKHGAFQHYSVLLATLCAPIPPTLPFTSAVVLPVGITTASAALYGPTLFALPLPVLAPPIPQSQSSTLVLWGGSSAVGLSTLQLARASGIEVIAVAGAHNFELCSSLGASRVFDHRDEAVVENVVRALEGKMCIGVFDTIGLTETIQAGVEILDKMDKGKGEKILVTTVPLMEALDLKAVEVKPGTSLFYRLGVPPPCAQTPLQPMRYPQNQCTNRSLRPVFSLSTLQSGIASAIWTDFLPAALASGAIIPQPPARIVGTGLESIQTGLDKSKEGYSATKLVVDLQRVPLSSGV